MHQIEFPCPESIEKMTPVQGGHHCKSCDQKIYDVTDMQESQIQDLKRIIPKLCVSYIEKGDGVGPKTFSVRKFAFAVLLVFGTGLFSFTNAQLSDEIINIKDKLLTSLEQDLPTYNLEVRIYNQYDATVKGRVYVVLPNGKTLIPYKNDDNLYLFLIPEYCNEKTIIVELTSGKVKKTKKMKRFNTESNNSIEIRIKAKHVEKHKVGRVVGYF